MALAEFSDHDTEVTCVDIDLHCSFAVSGSADGTLVLYDIKNLTHVRTLEAHQDSINAIQFTPEGNRIVTCSKDNTVKVIELGGSEIFSVNLRETMK